ncbi:MAG: ATP-binding protein [Acetobacteraceae bacterium]
MSFSQTAQPHMPGSRRGTAAPARPRTVSRRVPSVELDFLMEDESVPVRHEAEADIDIRQLRHHTKNALQRIMGLVAQAPGLCDTPQGEHIARQLERRIQLSASISDALFGLTRAPASMTDRLRSLCSNVVELLSDPTQVVQVGVSVRGDCPTHLRDTILRITHELVANAMKHGMRRRTRGRITVRLHSEPNGHTRLTVIDDGNGFHGKPRQGEGLSVAQMLADEFSGHLSLRSDGRTMAVLDMPPTGLHAGAAAT